MSKIKILFALSLMMTVAASVLVGPVTAVPALQATAFAATRTSATTGASGFACDGSDSPEKGWVLPVYVHQPGQDSYDSEVDSVVRTLWETDQTFDASAHRFGVSRRLRVVQDADCRPVVAKLAFTKGRNRAEMGKALNENMAAQPEPVRKLVSTNRVKLMFFVRDNEITDSCTGGGADAGLSNGGVILPRWCWSEAGFTHEMIHSFGLGHCNGGGVNGDDPVCRNMGSRPECTSDAASNYHLDSCRTDEFRYFEPTAASQPKGEALEKIRNVGFSPYLIQDRPTPALDFRLKAVDSGRCVDGARDQVVQGPCSGEGTVWRRSIDQDGYLTIRNTATGRCLTLADAADKAGAVLTAPCAAKKPAQQWLPQAGQDKINFTGRAAGKAGAALAVQKKETRDGAPVVRGSGSTFMAVPVSGQMWSPSPVTGTGTGGAKNPTTPAPTPAPTSAPTSAPAKTPAATPAPTATSAPTSGPTSAPTQDPAGTPEPANPPTSQPARNVTFESTRGTCLTTTGPAVRLGSCRTRWRLVPVGGKAVQVRSKGRCLALGKAGRSARSLVLAACGKAGKGQRWLLEPRRGGVVTLKSAGTRATRVISYAAKPSHIYAKAVYVSNSLKFTVR